MPGYAINPKYDNNTQSYTWDYDWTKDYNQRNVLFKSIEKNKEEIIVEGFSNSPPYFMTTSGCSSGSIDASKDNLKSDAYPAFAKYLVDVTEHFRKEWGIKFQSLAPMNEPNLSKWEAYSPKQEGCHFKQGESQSKIIVELKKALIERGLDDVIVSASDETNIDHQIKSYNLLSDEAKESISRIDTHTYQGNHRIQLRELAESEGKGLWMSEADSWATVGKNAGEMGAALSFANGIIKDLNYFRSSAWVIWQVIDGHICKNGYNGKKDSGMVNLDGGYWGVAVADHDKSEIILTQKYYAFGQFSRYIRPGYTIISGSEYSVAALDRDGKKLVIVAMSIENNDKNIYFDLSSFSKVGNNVKVIRTSGSVDDGEKWKELELISIDKKGFNASLKSNSITTYIIDGVEE